MQLNKVFLAGNLTRNPELKFIPSGQAVANISVATNRTYKAGSGEWKEEVTYVRVVTWGKSAEACGEYLKKGAPVMIEGRLKLKEWTATDGQKRSMMEVQADRVQFLGGNKSGPAKEDTPPEGFEPPPMTDDDIPF